MFAKPPVAGAAKTRLAPVVGAAGAAVLARAFFADSWRALGEVQGIERVLATTALPPEGLEVGPQAEVWLQGEGDLGERMERVLRGALSRAPLAIAVGADSPDLPMRLLEQAIAMSERHDVVLGPADDGGYFLIALRACPEGLLAGLPWSVAETRSRTIEQLERRGLSVGLTEPWFDVDVPADLERLERLLRSGAIAAPETARCLAALRATDGP
jgi:hypothetical protein